MTKSPAYLRTTSTGLTLAVRAQPGAKKTAITGIYDTTQLKIAVHAPPLEGRANAALFTFLADIFSVSKSSVSLVSGDSSRSKVFLIRGLNLDQAHSVLAAHLAPS
jgi:hypothetical protein